MSDMDYEAVAKMSSHELAAMYADYQHIQREAKGYTVDDLIYAIQHLRTSLATANERIAELEETNRKLSAESKERGEALLLALELKDQQP